MLHEYRIQIDLPDLGKMILNTPALDTTEAIEIVKNFCGRHEMEYSSIRVVS
jgi:hypothetical protein